MSDTTAGPSSNSPAALMDMSQDAMLAKMVEMGFPVQESREALIQSHGDVEAACELLANAYTATGGRGFFNSLIRCFING